MCATYHARFVPLWCVYTNSIHSTAKSNKDRQCTYKRNIEALSRNRCCRGKALSTTHYESVSVALVIPYAKRMRRIILPSLACWLYHIFLHYLINGTTFGGKILIEHKLCFEFPYNFCLKRFSF
jgi:hypothetical protein